VKNTLETTASTPKEAQRLQPYRIIIIGLSVAYAVFFLLMLWAAYRNQLPFDWLASRLPYYDKLGHLILYCIPTYLGHRLCKHKHFQLGCRLPVFPVLFMLFTIAEEIVQGLSPYRTLDTVDMACSLIGIGMGYGLAQRSAKS